MTTNQMVINIRFYEELNDFLKPGFRKKELIKHLNHRTTTKDIIESYGIPHTEVDLILVNGESVGFNHHVNHLDRISVYPVFESLNILPTKRLNTRPISKLMFIADVHLGKLVRRLRLVGLDTLYRNDYNNIELLEIVKTENRVLLTRNRRLLMHNVVQQGIFIRSDAPYKQAVEVLNRFDISSSLNPFSRCVACNQAIEPVQKEKIMNQLEPLTQRYYSGFKQCISCKQVYWKGSHYPHLLAFVQKIKNRDC